MHVALVSGDEALRRMCREALAALPSRQWCLRIASPGEAVPDADLFIWDSGTLSAEVLERRRAQQHMLVIGRGEAAEILAAVPLAAVTLVLKPVQVDTLKTFLEQTASAHDLLDSQKAIRDGSLRHDRDALLDCLLATSLRLQEHDQDRMNFLARAVHDFRTPLTAVAGYCGLLLSEQLGPLSPTQQTVLQRTLHSVRRLTRLATGLFQWSSGMRVGLQSRFREADIQECCCQAVHEVKPFADEKSISIELDLQAPEQALYFDPAQIEQVLVNLLENSCKFTLRGGYIRIRGYSAFWDRRSATVSQDGVWTERRGQISRRPNAYRMEVSDNGMGVRSEHLRTIFQEYTSYGGGQDRSGSGLGLAICKRILNEHGGQIFAESDGQGVTFTFLLPCRPPFPSDSYDGEPDVAELEPVAAR